MEEKGLPTKEEFYRTIIRLKKEKEYRREAIYLAYLQDQKLKRKPQRKRMEGIWGKK